MARIKKETQNHITELLKFENDQQRKEYLEKLSPIERIDITVALINQTIKKPKRIK